MEAFNEFIFFATFFIMWFNFLISLYMSWVSQFNLSDGHIVNLLQPRGECVDVNASFCFVDLDQ